MRPPRRRWGVPSTLVLLLTLAISVSPPPPSRRTHPGLRPGARRHTLTLVTGAELVVEEFPGRPPGDHRRPGRAVRTVSFDTIAYGGQTYVLPSDAAALVPDVLDRELFNVTKLLDYGYTDGVPGIVDYQSAAGAPPAAPAGMAGAQLQRHRHRHVAVPRLVP